MSKCRSCFWKASRQILGRSSLNGSFHKDGTFIKDFVSESTTKDVLVEILTREYNRISRADNHLVVTTKTRIIGSAKHLAEPGRLFSRLDDSSSTCDRRDSSLIYQRFFTVSVMKGNAVCFFSCELTKGKKAIESLESALP
jgi:hypothetical protein